MDFTPFNILRSVFGLSTPERPSQEVDPWEFGESDLVKQYYSSMEMKKGTKPDYNFYDQMDEDEVISSVLDAYAEDSTQVNYDTNRTVWCESSNPDIVKIVHDLFDEIVLEEFIYSIVRDLAKYGNTFEGANGGFDQGVIGLDSKDPRKVTRREHLGKLLGFQFEGSKETIPPWAIVHFRLLTRNRRNPYGDSILWNARKIYRKVKWIEDAVILYRLRRAPDRTIWYIDTGAVGPQEQLKLANKWRHAVKKNLAKTGDGLRQDIRILAADEDIFFPKNKNNDSKIDVLKGSNNVGDIWDLEYFLNKLFGSLRAPKAYFGFEGEIDAKASLVQQDFKYARGCVKLQRATLVGLATLVQIHLAFKRMDPLKEENEFILRMSPVSFLEEQFRQELVNLRVDTVDKLVDMGEKLGFNKDEWVNHVLKQFGGFTAPEIEKFHASTEKDQSETLEKLISNTGFQKHFHSSLMESLGAFESKTLGTSYHIPKV